MPTQTCRGEVLRAAEQPVTPHRPHKGRNPYAPLPARILLSESRACEMRSEVAQSRGLPQEKLFTPETNIYEWVCSKTKNSSVLLTKAL